MALHKSGVYLCDTDLASFTECKLAVEEQQMKLNIKKEISYRKFLLCRKGHPNYK